MAIESTRIIVEPFDGGALILKAIKINGTSRVLVSLPFNARI